VNVAIRIYRLNPVRPQFARSNVPSVLSVPANFLMHVLIVAASLFHDHVVLQTNFKIIPPLLNVSINQSDVPMLLKIFEEY